MDNTPAAKLRALKIRLSVDEVAQIVQRLVNGETAYQIGKPDTGGHAKATVGKINALRLAGQLNFLVDAPYEQTVAQAAPPQNLGEEAKDEPKKPAPPGQRPRRRHRRGL